MVRTHDSLQEIPNVSMVHPTSYDVDDDDDDKHEAATYTIAHINTAARKTGPVILNYSKRRNTEKGGEPDLLGTEIKVNEKPQEREHLSPSASVSPTTDRRNRIRYHTNFTAWKRKKDSKIVGLKHYGLESPRHQLHNTLSDLDDHYSSSYSKGHGTTQPLPSQPKRNMFNWWMGDRHHDRNQNHLPYRSNNHQYNHSNTATPTNMETTHHNVTNRKDRLFAVEKEEEMVRKNVTKNPFILFYLGNLAAFKVLIYYFSKYFNICVSVVG